MISKYHGYAEEVPRSSQKVACNVGVICDWREGHGNIVNVQTVPLCISRTTSRRPLSWYRKGTGAPFKRRWVKLLQLVALNNFWG
jgi:hypothetical protein